MTTDNQPLPWQSERTALIIPHGSKITIARLQSPELAAQIAGAFNALVAELAAVKAQHIEETRRIRFELDSCRVERDEWKARWRRDVAELDSKTAQFHTLAETHNAMIRERDALKAQVDALRGTNDRLHEELRGIKSDGFGTGARLTAALGEVAS